MARLRRIDHKMGWHHVTNHVTGEGDLFLSDMQRHMFMRLLVWAGKRTGVEVAAFCLMGNHFHLVLHCPDGRLSEFMHLVESVYGRHFAGVRGIRGPVFVDRFHNRVIRTDEQLLVASRYVDRNGLELGLDISQYPWSSFPTHVDGFGNHAAALSRSCDFPVRLSGGPDAYREFVSTDGPSDKFSFRAGRRRVSATPYAPVDVLLTEIATLAASFSGLPLSSITHTQRGARSGGKLAAVLVAHNASIAFADELVDFFGYAARSSLTSAIRRAEARVETHVEFRALVDSIDFGWRNESHRQAS